MTEPDPAQASRSQEAPLSDSGSEVDEDLHEELVDESIFCLAAHADSVYAAAWAGTSQKLLATGGGDDVALLWKLVSALMFTADGQKLATGGLDGDVRIWASRNGLLLHILQGPSEGIEWVSWHPGGQLVAAGSEDYTAWIWDSADGSALQVLAGHSGSVTCGMFSFDGALLLTGGGENDCSLRIWNTHSGECTATVCGHPFHSAGVTRIALHPQGTAVVSGDDEGSVKLTALPSFRVTATLTGHNESIEDVAFCNVLPVVITGSMDSQAIIWDLATAHPRQTCPHPEGVTRVACHRLQPLLFTACLDGMVRCWDIRSGSCLRIQGGHSSGIQDMALHYGGQLILTASDDQTARVFDFGLDDDGVQQEEAS